MDKKTTGLIITLVTVMLCGCPGLVLCLGGAFTAAGLSTYEASLPGVVNETGGIPAGVGIPMLCFGILFMIIPIVAVIITLRMKSDSDEEAPVSLEQ